MSVKPDLSPTQARAIAALVQSRTLQDAAAKAKCGESTLRRWLQEHAGFQAAWREARRHLVDRAVTHTQQSAEAAVLTLHSFMINSKSDYIKIAAARAILDIAVRAIERDDLQAQVAQLQRDVETLHHAQSRYVVSPN